jgi:hypothetical protein
LKPKNHHQENVKFLRDLQQKNSERSNRPASAEPFKLSRFKTVESQVRKTLQDWDLREDSGEQSQRSRPSSGRSFTRKGDGVAKLEIRNEEARKARGTAERLPARKPPIPKMDHWDETSQRHSEEVDFLRKNAIAVIKANPGGHAADRSIDINERWRAQQLFFSLALSDPGCS